MTELIRKDFLPLAKPHITDDEIEAVSDVIRSGWWTTGPKSAEFEQEFSKYLNGDGSKMNSIDALGESSDIQLSNCEPLQTVGLSSCTAALHLSLLALGVGPGDEVIVPTWTFAATAEVVEWVGAKPVLCDIDERTLNIDLAAAKLLITPRTKAIIPVHIAGYPCEMKELAELAAESGLKVIEDAAHAIGTKYRGTLIGNFSDITCFSFYATKNLAMGEGGAAVSRNADLIEKIRKLSYFGINKDAFKRYEKAGSWRYDIEEIGYKNNLDSVHAALGIVQLRKLDEMNERRREISEMYRGGLDPRLGLPADSEEHYNPYHLFMIRIPATVISRDDLSESLKMRNIGTSVHFIPLHLHTHYKGKFTAESSAQSSFPTADRVFAEILSLPMFPSMTDGDVQYVIENVNQILENRAE